MNQKAACGLWTAEVHLSTEATGSAYGLFRCASIDGVFTSARVLMGKVLRQERLQEHSELNSSLCCLCVPDLCVSHQRCASSMCLGRRECVSGGMDKREKGAI